MIGSGNDRWHNILRNGLDFQETTNGRVRLLVVPPDARRTVMGSTLRRIIAHRQVIPVYDPECPKG